MTIETFSMDAELAPFLRGEVLIFDMRLVRPKATIDIAADGAVDWAMRPSSPFDVNNVAIEKLTVTDGRDRAAPRGRRAQPSPVRDQCDDLGQVAGRTVADGWLVARSTACAPGCRHRPARSRRAGRCACGLRADPDAYPLTIESRRQCRHEGRRCRLFGPVQDRRRRQERGAAARPDDQPIKVSGGKSEPGYRLNGAVLARPPKLGIAEFRFETGPLDNPYTADGTASVDLGADAQLFHRGQRRAGAASTRRLPAARRRATG